MGGLGRQRESDLIGPHTDSAVMMRWLTPILGASFLRAGYTLSR